MSEIERQEIATVGIEIITGNITEDDVKEAIIESYLERRSEVSAEKLEAEVIDALAGLYVLLAVREATIGAMAEVIDELE